MTGLARLSLAALARTLFAWCGRDGRPAESGGTAMCLGSGAVSREVNMRIVLPADKPQCVPVRMRYDIADPYAVCARLPDPPGDGVTWVFARDLMAQGLEAPTGDGDVRIGPTALGEDRIRIALMSPDGEVLMQAATADLAEFLDQSFSLCSAGSEGEHLNVDGELQMLLAS